MLERHQAVTDKWSIGSGSWRQCVNYRHVDKHGTRRGEEKAAPGFPRLPGYNEGTKWCLSEGSLIPFTKGRTIWSLIRFRDSRLSSLPYKGLADCILQGFLSSWSLAMDVLWKDSFVLDAGICTQAEERSKLFPLTAMEAGRHQNALLCVCLETLLLLLHAVSSDFSSKKSCIIRFFRLVLASSCSGHSSPV